MKIITSGSGYPEKRNIMTSPHNKYIDCRKKNIYFYLNAVKARILHKNKQFIFLPLPGLLPHDADVIHLFNEVADTKRNWIATFETEIPRVLPVPGVAKFDNPQLKSQLQLIARSECLTLIAISQATLDIQLKTARRVSRDQSRCQAQTPYPASAAAAAVRKAAPDLAGRNSLHLCRQRVLSQRRRGSGAGHLAINRRGCVYTRPDTGDADR